MPAPLGFGIAQAGVQLADTIGGIAGAFSSAAIAREQGRIEQQRRIFSAKMLQLSADSIIRSSHEASQAYLQEASRVMGSQRVVGASQGISVTRKAGERGSAFNRLQRDTRYRAMNDILRLQNNAMNKAFGLRTQAANEQAAGMFARRQANLSAQNTILSGVTGAISSSIRMGKGLYDAGLFTGNGQSSNMVNTYDTNKFSYDAGDAARDIFWNNKL